jgi:hypothetical protein
VLLKLLSWIGDVTHDAGTTRNKYWRRIGIESAPPQKPRLPPLAAATPDGQSV